MKRACIIILIIMSIITFPAQASVNNITYAVLSRMIERVTTQGYVTPDDTYTLSIGVYTVGIDIPEGSWCLEYGSSALSLITIDDGYVSNQYAIYNPFTREYSTPALLTCIYTPLRKGTKLVVEGGSINIQPFERLFTSW